MPPVYIILVNWNGWQDTIECLEALFRLDYSDYSVIVCDNASTDGSVEQIKAWANGKLDATAVNPRLETLTRPAVPKPISFLETSASELAGLAKKQSARLTLIHAGSNLGFAGGNNIGLRYALSIGDLEFAWLLNNDTVVTSNALSEMVQRMKERTDSGLCGSTLLEYENPDRVQALGGSTFNKWVARSGHIGRGISTDDVPVPEIVEAKMKYVIGASMLVRKSFLKDVGLMNQSYFLYFEEIDWATRASGKYSLAYAPHSVVYHKQGTSAGTSFERANRSYTSEYYSSRGRMLFTRKYFPIASPVVACSLLAGGLLRYTAGNTSGAQAIFSGLKDSLNHHA
jgi:GT2 family glycosyltransferase